MSNRRTIAARCMTVLACLLLATALYAQTTGGGVIQGTVKDATGAVIPAAKITVENVATSQRHTTSANEVGFYLFPALLPGNYKFAAEAAGMQTWQGQLTLQVGQTAVVDVAMVIGSTASEVTVAGDVTPLLTLDSPTTAGVLERTRIEQLPLNSRFLQNLVVATVPGLEGGGDAPRVNGLTRSAMGFLQDGVDIANREADNANAGSRPPGIDSVQEFRVETAISSAKMNRPATAIISTRSGTNQFHGSLFETARNNGVGVARQRQDFYTKPPFLVRNEFGASGGGPVYIPHVYNGTNRTFFFFAWEAFRNAQASTISTNYPTVAMRQGDFSGLLDGTGRLQTLYDPWTTDSKTWQRQPFPGNVIPLSKESPVAKYMWSVTALPTMPDVNPLIGNNFSGAYGVTRRDHTETMRLDHRLSERDQIFVRYNFGNRNQPYILDAGLNPPTLDGKTGKAFWLATTQNGLFSWIHTFSPRFFSETLVSGMNEDLRFAASDGTMPNLVGDLGLPNPTNQKFPGVILWNTGSNGYYKTQEGRNATTRPLNVDQNFTLIRGRHQLQFGGRWRRDSLYTSPDETYLAVYFNSPATSLYDPASGSSYAAVPRTGNNAGSFFLGVANQYTLNAARSSYNLLEREYAAYLQDDFKVSPRLTLNLGLRYENFPAMTEANNLLSGFDLNSHSVVIGRSLEDLYRLGVTTPEVVADYQQVGVKFITPQEAGQPAGIVKGNPWNFGPRAGFAWRLGSGARTTVIRGGYSLFRHNSYNRTFTRFMRTNPPFGFIRSALPNNAAQSPDGLPNYQLRSVPTTIAGVNSKDALSTEAARKMNPGSPTSFYFNPEQPPLQAHEWNLLIERELIKNTVLRLGYTGTHGANLDQYYLYNAPPNNYIWFARTGLPLPTGTYAGTATRGYDQTTWGNLYEYGHVGWSNASSFRIEAERRYSRGVGFQIFYVMTNASQVGGESEYGQYMNSPSEFLPGAVPEDPVARNRLLNYQRTTAVPKHRVRWNWVVDLPFGRGQKFAGNAGRFLDRLIGGWQIAGMGTTRSNYWALPTGNWGQFSDIEIYGTKYPIEDCRSGTCFQGYLYYNGYIPANRINSYGANGKPNGVMGVPSSYHPSSQPIFPTPADGGSPSDPNYANYETNTVWVPMKNGTLQKTTINTNLHPWRNQYVPGPWSTGLDASLFKRIAITERVALRFNADFFNVLNMPGLNQPNSGDGILSLRNSAQAARQLQLTLRLSW